MKIQTVCPGCGKRSGLDSSLVGRRVRCKECGHVFQVSDEARDERDAPADRSWLDDGADGETVAPAPLASRRTTTTVTGGGPSSNLMITLGAVAILLVAAVIGLTSLGGGRGPAPDAKKGPPAEPPQAGPGILDRVVNAVTGHDPDADVAEYPDLGPLPPPLQPPQPLRDLSSHERQSRISLAAIDQMAGVLAGVHDAPSLKSALEQLLSLGQRMVDDLRREPPPFRLTPAEDAELIRRTASEGRRVVGRVQQEARRIAGLPGLGTAGVQLNARIEPLVGPVERAIQQAENFQPPPPPPAFAEVFIRLHADDDATFFHRALDDLQEGGGIQASHRLGGDDPRGSYRVWPVDDAKALSRKIPHGAVTVKGRRIFVRAEPIPPAEVAAAKEAQERIRLAREAEIKAMTPPDPEADDPKPPDDADELTRALFALRSGNPGKRKDGVSRIARTAPVEDRRAEVHAALATLLDDPDGFTVTDVMKAMVQWRTDDTVPAIVKILDRSDFGARWAAEDLLGQLGDPRAAGPLAARLGEDSIKAGPALKALGPAAEPALIELLRDRDPRVRTEACRILKDVGGKDALQAMMGLPADSDFGAQVAARDAMQAMRARVGPVAAPARGKR